MRQENIFTMKSLYRENFTVTGFRFGTGAHTACIIGSLRGNEYQQIYACSHLVKKLRHLEEEGRIADGQEILVIPCGNPFSVNIKKRFWGIDSTDVNRMFPGYDLGETTQRIAYGLFAAIKGYRYGIQFASFYRPGSFVPQVRLMKTGFEDVALAREFGMPYVILHHPRPFDTTTLNYNWQVFGTKAFSLYTTSTSAIDTGSAEQAVRAILHFLARQGVIRYHGDAGFVSRVVETTDMITVRTTSAGFFRPRVAAGYRVERGEVLAHIKDPYLAETNEEIRAPLDGTVAFLTSEPLVGQSTTVLKLIPEAD